MKAVRVLKGTGNWKPWQIYAAGAAVCAGLTLGAWAAAVRPVLGERAARETLATRVSQRARAAAEKAAALDAANRQLDQVRQSLAAAPLRLEPESRLNLRLDRVTTLAAGSGLRIDEVQPGAAEDGPHFRTVPVRLVATGPYAACAAFLHRLRAEFPDTGARSFDASNTSPDPENPTATLRLELVWFTAPTPRAAP